MPTLAIIDGHAQFFRAYHAIRSGITSPVTKEPTNMTFGFTAMLLKLLRESRPDYLAVVIDAAGDTETFRSQLYPEYKAHRAPPPDDFRPQVERCLQVLKQMRIPVLAEPGVEADDVIATLTRRLTREHADLEIRIISRDKDLTQLIDDRVHLFDPHKGELVTPEKLFETPGVKPSQVADILALMGDTVDNVPGVPGVGPKTAAGWVIQYGSLDNLLANLGQIKGKKRESLEQSRELIAMSRRLVQLKDDVELTFELEAAKCDCGKIDAESLQALFRELGFNRLREELAALTGGGAAKPEDRAKPQAAALVEGGLFEQSLASSPAHVETKRGEYQLIGTEKQLKDVVAQVRRNGWCALDTETDSLAIRRANLCGVSMSIAPGSGVFIPSRSCEPGRHLTTDQILAVLKPVLEDPTIRKIGQNLKFDINVLRQHGVRVRGVSFDTMIASYLIDSARTSHKLDHLALALLNYVCIPLTDLIGTGKNQKTFDQAPLDQAVQYASEDADVALRLRDVLEPQLNAMGLRKLFDELELPLIEVLAELEFNGIKVDRQELDRQSEKLAAQIKQLKKQIADASPHPFNPDSPKQLAAALFNKPGAEPPGLGIKPLRRGKTGPSTDQEVLEKIAADPTIDSPVPKLIVEYRQLTKLVNTYLVALAEAIDPGTGRVHASFHQTVAATGRLSSSDPNLQNIPIRTEIGREIRRAFVAEPGNVLLTADYSQIELRLLAHLAEDPALIEAFQQGQDIHTAVAAEVFGIKPPEVTGDQRSSAKMVNFGIIYGITAYGLARRLGPGVSNEQAARIIADYKARFSRIDEFLDRCVQQARTLGYVETIMRRRRAIPQVHSTNAQERALGERVAINSVVQGSAADLIKVAMVNLHRKLPSAAPGTKMLLQIHDELVFETPAETVEQVRSFVAGEMERAMTLKVPLVVGSAWSRNWIDAK